MIKKKLSKSKAHALKPYGKTPFPLFSPSTPTLKIHIEVKEMFINYKYDVS